MNVLTFRALSLRRIATALFGYSSVVSRHNKSIKIDFLVTLMVYHRKIGTFIKKQNALANWVSFKDLIELKSTNSVLCTLLPPFTMVTFVLSEV